MNYLIIFALIFIQYSLLLNNVVSGQWSVDPWSLNKSSNPAHKCIMWGECHDVGIHRRNCYYDGLAPQLFHPGVSDSVKEEVIDIAERRCPHILLDENGQRLPDDEIFTCCAVEQIIGIGSNALMAEGALGRCPACLHNFLRQICEMNCAPDQSRFVSVEVEPLNDELNYIEEVNYRMYEDYMLEAHESCSGVIIPQTGLPAINLMCGNAPVCDAEAWFGFSGDIVNNPFTPVQVNFLRWPTPEDSMSVVALKCNETFGNDIQCSCLDCFKNCPSGLEPSLPDICTVLSVNCIGFSISITFFVITVIIFTTLTLIDYRKLRKNPDFKDENYKPEKPNKIISTFEHIFSKIGGYCAGNPVHIIMLTSWLCFAMLFGVFQLKLTSNPIELWSSPDSRTRQELNYFNTRFGPFYRPAQIYLRVTGFENFTIDNIEYGPAFNYEAIQELIKLEDEILKIGRNDGGVVLEQVCYAPMRQRGDEDDIDLCVWMSAATYFGEDRHNIDNTTYLSRIQNCLNNYLALDCMAPWGGGAEPEMAFGGFEGTNVLSADTLVISIPISNHLIQENLIPVLEWEQRFLDFMHDYEANWKADFIDVAFAAERSIEDEIQRVSEAEIIPISISYVLMLIYVTFSLGHIRTWRTFFIDSKMSVGLSSIIVVLLAIFCAIGLMGYIGITTTLLAINVIPFFVLSVGIDNVFLMVNKLEEVKNSLKENDDFNINMPFEQKRKYIFEKMMKQAGPSIFVTSLTQITCFGIGAISNVPAVFTFAVFATFAMTFLFIFQITIVVAILSIDYRRSSQNRFDILCCVQKKILDDTNPLASDAPHISVTQKLMKPYSKFILNWRSKIIVAMLFMAFVSVSTMLIPQIEIGLDQELALPKDSYVYKYLQAVNDLLRIGPPIFFVLTPGLNYTDPVHQNVLCGGQLCNVDSLTTQIFLASRHSNITYIAQSSNSWIDDFFDWSTLRGACCQYNVQDGTFCTSTNTSAICQFCDVELDDNRLRPLQSGFERYIPFFLRDPPTEQCNKGGLASYGGGVNYLLDFEGRATVEENHFMAFHSPLATSHDYIQAVKYAQEISYNITKAIHNYTGVTDVEVFPYSVFYVFFEQYLTVWGDTFTSLSYSIVAALVLHFVLSGFNFITTFAVIFTTIMVIVNMMGMMYIWRIPLNAVSCVNLIVSIGISVEFCSHTAYAFSTSKAAPRKKAQDALRRVGSTIITGITFTNIPIIVLAFSYTELIEMFFFRMFFGLVIIGFLHGMVFLPVLLSFISNVTSYPRKQQH